MTGPTVLEFLPPSPGGTFEPDQPDVFAEAWEGRPRETPDDTHPLTPDVPVCSACGLEIPYSGRGRKPKMHPECREAAKNEGSTPRVPRRASKGTAERVAEKLYMGMGELSVGIGVFAPVTGVTIGLRAERTVNALIDIGQKYPAFMAGLETAADAMPYIDLGATAGAVIYAMGVDAGRLDPRGIVAEGLGVSEAARRVGWVPPTPAPEYAEYEPVTVDGTFDVPVPPPAFTMKRPKQTA